MRTPLPVTSCEGCGECCTQVGTPPGLFAAYASPLWDGKYLTEAPDYQVWLAMPEELRRQLADYYRDNSGRPSRYDEGLPCLWFDEQTRKCRHYDHRPEACREFEVGSAECVAWRGNIVEGTSGT